MDFSATDLIRVLRGDPDNEQLAAVTVVLLTRMSAGAAEPDQAVYHRRQLAHWRRPERVTGFRGPHSWTAPPRWKGQHQH
jgi:Acyl-CoA carboxylase epsilon subunit